jgi:hypothetical protein
MERLPSGSIAYRMKRPAPNGATHRVMTPLDLLGALASLIPPPRVHLTRFHGIFAPHARDRAAVVPRRHAEDGAPAGPAAPGDIPPHRRLPWADLLKKVFAIDVFVCDRCGGRRRILAAITEPVAVRAILEHVGLSARAPPIAPARPPPQDQLEPTCVDPEPTYE